MTEIGDDGPRNRILLEMQALDAEVDRAVNGHRASREATRAVARKYDDLLRSALATLGNGEPAVELVLEGRRKARELVLGVFGTSGWDEPAGAPASLGPLPAAPGSDDRQPPPLTDEDLARIDDIAGADEAVGEYARALHVRWALRGYYGERKADAEKVALPTLARLLVAEVRRLRSDEWLRAAAVAIARDWTPEGIGAATAETDSKVFSDTLVEILRKHRDGGA